MPSGDPFPLLRDVAPVFAEELRELIESKGEIRLLEQLEGLQIVDRCRCKDRSCAAFYTVPPPPGSWGDGHRNVMLVPRKGMVVLDVVNDKVTMVEVLDRPDVRKVIDGVMPL